MTPNGTRATLPCDDGGRDFAYFLVGRASVGWRGGRSLLGVGNVLFLNLSGDSTGSHAHSPIWALSL